MKSKLFFQNYYFKTIQNFLSFDLEIELGHLILIEISISEQNKNSGFGRSLNYSLFSNLEKTKDNENYWLMRLPAAESSLKILPIQTKDEREIATNLPFTW